MKIRTLILDYDGPILDGKLRHWRCYADILASWGYPPLPLEIYWDMKRRRIDRRQQLAQSGAESRYDDFLKAWLERIEDRQYLALDKLQEGAVDTLRSWKSRGLRSYLLTLRQSDLNLRWQLATLGIAQLFDGIQAVGIDKGEAGKADAVRALLEPADLESTLWIGDTEVDIQAARDVGVACCALECGMRTGAYLASLKPAMLLPDLKSVPI